MKTKKNAHYIFRRNFNSYSIACILMYLVIRINLPCIEKVEVVTVLKHHVNIDSLL